MPDLQPSLNQLFRIWWLRAWRGALGGAVAVAPFALGFYLLERAHIRSTPVRLAEQAVIVLIGGAIAWAVSRMALTKRYRDFRIALLPPGADGPELALTNRRVLSFWWFLVWRVTAGAAAISLAGELAAQLFPQAGTIREGLVVAAILAWEFLVLWLALTRRYRDFRIVVISEPPGALTLRRAQGEE